MKKILTTIENNKLKIKYDFKNMNKSQNNITEKDMNEMTIEFLMENKNFVFKFYISL